MNYDEFIKRVLSAARLSSLGDAVAAVRATLETLAERMTREEVKDTSSQLPREIAYYLEHRAETLDKFGLDEFLKRVSQREPADLPTATYHARVVIAVLQEAVTKGQIDDIRGHLPDEFAPLFESGPEGRMKVA